MENWGRLSHLFVAVFLSYFCELMVSPAIPDVTLAAICPGKDECSAAIYFTGFQQAIAGVGSVIMMPLIGNLSDIYGRKKLMTIPLVLSILPFAVLAWKRTTIFFYAYFVIKTLTAIITQGGFLCLALAYLADNVSEGKRVSAFGVLSGVLYIAFVGGTFVSRLLSMDHIFQVAAAVSIFAAIYNTVFLKETPRQKDGLEQPILKVTENNEDNHEASKKIDVIGNIPSPRAIYILLKSSVTFSLAAFVAFFNSLAEAGLQACLLYFLKARFHYNKDQCADVLLIAYIGAAISNTLFVPMLGPRIGEEILLSLGLLAGFFNMFFDSIAWAPWVKNTFIIGIRAIEISTLARKRAIAAAATVMVENEVPASPEAHQLTVEERLGALEESNASLKLEVKELMMCIRAQLNHAERGGPSHQPPPINHHPLPIDRNSPSVDDFSKPNRRSTYSTRLECSQFIGVDIRSWIQNCENFFNLCNINDDERVDIASMHMSGKASTWVNSYLESHPQVS